MMAFLSSVSLPLTISAITMALAVLLATWVGHTDRSREEIAILRAVIRGYIDPETGCTWNDKVFAARIGVSEYQLSRIFSGRDALNFHRLADLPEAFRAQWDAARAAARGARIYESEELAFFRGIGAALPPRRRALRMTAPLLPLRREA